VSLIISPFIKENAGNEKEGRYDFQSKILKSTGKERTQSTNGEFYSWRREISSNDGGEVGGKIGVIF
jgi:hypothetical protein